MTEPTVAGASAAIAGSLLSTIPVASYLGVDWSSLVWGICGGVIMIFLVPTQRLSIMQLFGALFVAGITAAGFSELLGMSVSPGYAHDPQDKLEIAIAILLGATAKGLWPVVFQLAPTAFRHVFPNLADKMFGKREGL